MVLESLIESLVQFASKAELSIAPGSHQGPASTIAPTNLADGDALPLLPTLKCLSSRREQKKPAKRRALSRFAICSLEDQRI